MVTITYVNVRELIMLALKLKKGKQISFMFDEDGYIYVIRDMSDVMPVDHMLMLYCPGMEGNQHALLCPKNEDCFTEEDIENWFNNENPCQDEEPEYNGQFIIRNYEL